MFGQRHALAGGERYAGPRGGGRFGGGEGSGPWDMDGSGRGRGDGRRRMFDGGELRLVLLKLIADKSRHGYDLIRAIEDLTGGVYAPSPGVVLSDTGPCRARWGSSTNRWPKARANSLR